MVKAVPRASMVVLKPYLYKRVLMTMGITTPPMPGNMSYYELTSDKLLSGTHRSPKR